MEPNVKEVRRELPKEVVKRIRGSAIKVSYGRLRPVIRGIPSSHHEVELTYAIRKPRKLRK